MERDCNVYTHSSLWMRPTRPDRYNAKMVYSVTVFFFGGGEEEKVENLNWALKMLYVENKTNLPK